MEAFTPGTGDELKEEAAGKLREEACTLASRDE